MSTLELIDQSLLFICCIVLYLLQTDYTLTIIPILIALTFGSLCSYFEKPHIHLFLLCTYIFLCFLMAELILFLPVVLYTLWRSNNEKYAPLCLIPIVYQCSYNSYKIYLFTLIFISLSYLLKHRTRTLYALKERYTHYQDTTKESTLLLEQKNYELMEKQDYEIHVAMLNERNRIARDIHDNVGHLLSRCILQIGAVMTLNTDPLIMENLELVKDTLNTSMNSIRQSVHNLHDESIDLYTELINLTENFSFCPIKLDYDMAQEVDIKLKYCFIAIIKESLANIIKHSTATEVKITLRSHPALYQLIIQDNGLIKDYKPERGIGLNNMKERVTTFKGTFLIQTEQGFRVFISIPKEPI